MLFYHTSDTFRKNYFQAVWVKNALPSLDATGKVHGTLPKVEDLGKYSKEELRILLKELRQSVQNVLTLLI